MNDLTRTPLEIPEPGMHGFEKEGIRITAEGNLSLSRHPEALGSSLMHPFITTDFAESQIEFRTRPSAGVYQSLQHLKELHVYTTKALKDEYIWPFSMPPRLPAKEEHIPLAVYGSSSLGKKKTIYRRGIGLRYGRRKLTISGVHYNFSLAPSFDTHGLPAFDTHGLPDSPGNDNSLPISDCYFHVIRNLYRKIFYLTYLFGASPAFDKSFGAPRINRFKQHKSSTYYGEFATSLRASDIGYTSAVQDQLPMNYDSLEAYIKSLSYAVFTGNPAYEKLKNDRFSQLNANYLQAEYELYAPFRPKQQLDKGERLLDAMGKKSVGWLEVRLPDIDPAFPDGIDPRTMGFLHLAMMDCLMSESPPLTSGETTDIGNAHREIIWNGRKKGLCMPLCGRKRSFHDAGKKYCEGLYKLAEKMDRAWNLDLYGKSLHLQIEKWESPESTPSGKMLSHLLDNNKEFIQWGVEIAEKNARYYRTCESDPDSQREIEIQSSQTLALQHELEDREKEVQ